MTPLDSPWWTWALSGLAVGWAARSALQWLKELRPRSGTIVMPKVHLPEGYEPPSAAVGPRPSEHDG